MTLQVDAAGDGEFEETHQASDYFDGGILAPEAPTQDESQDAFPIWLIAVGVAVLVLAAMLVGFLRRRSRMRS